LIHFCLTTYLWEEVVEVEASVMAAAAAARFERAG
jgi:hypothetical protein